jgi:EF hand
MYGHGACKGPGMRKTVTYLLLGLLSLGLTSSFAEAPKKKAKQSAARGATARTPPAPPNPANDAAFYKHDLNRDGQVSKAEAAGHYDLIMGFDKSDRNRDGKLSRAEYDRYTERLATAKTKTASTK